MGRFVRWLRHFQTRRCRHPGDLIVADILSGDFHGGPGGEQGVEWCRRCGAYRRTFDIFGARPRYGDWERPYA